jgi:hypothetical protein
VHLHGAGMSFPVSLYDALVSIDVPPEKARAVIDAMEREMGATLATKTDLLLLRQDLRQEIGEIRQELRQEVGAVTKQIGQLRQEVNQEFTLVRKEMELQRSSMTVRLGSIQVVAAGLLFAALKLT